MEPTLTWIDLTSTDRDKMRRVLDLFSESGTIDEMGLGSLRDGLSDHLFPGTSSIQTRLRYVLFVAWIYKALEAERVANADLLRRLRAAEVELIGPLMRSQDAKGVIGAVAGAAVGRLPSSVYWNALTRWRIFLPARGATWYHANFAGLSRNQSPAPVSDDPGIAHARTPTWHPRLPQSPGDFRKSAEFALTRQEAVFVQGRIAEGCHGSLLACFAQKTSPVLAPTFWDDPLVATAPAQVQHVVELARRFSLLVEGAPLMYNLLLAERKDALLGGCAARIVQYHGEITEWFDREQQEQPIDLGLLWNFAKTAGIRRVAAQVAFVERWAALTHQQRGKNITGSKELRELVEHRERDLKGRSRARLANPERLATWSGSVGVGRMDFRWFRVRQLLTDLHHGLVS